MLTDARLTPAGRRTRPERLVAVVDGASVTFRAGLTRCGRLLFGALAGLVVVSCAPDDLVPAVTTTVEEVTSTTEASSETSTTSVVTSVAEESDRTGAAELPLRFTEVAGTMWEGRIVVVGGLDAGGEASDRTYIYDPEADSWASGPNLLVGLHHTAVTTLGDRVYVVGGYSGGERGWVPEAAVWSLGPGDESWLAEPDLATARGALAVVSMGDRLLAIGGVGPDAEYLASTEVLEPGDSEWQPGPELAEPREHLAATSAGDRVYAIAGRTGGMDTNKSSVEVLVSEEWDEAPSLNFTRGGIGAATVDGMPCVAGGEEPEGTIGTVECLVDGTWQVVAELEVPRHGLAVVAMEGAIHVIGGGPSPGLATSGAHEVIVVEG